MECGSVPKRGAGSSAPGRVTVCSCKSRREINQPCIQVRKCLYCTFRSTPWKEDGAKSLSQDNTVKPDGPVPDVPSFELHAVVHSQFVAATHLPKTRHSRSCREDGNQFLAKTCSFLQHIGARPNQAHLAS